MTKCIRCFSNLYPSDTGEAHQACARLPALAPEVLEARRRVATELDHSGGDRDDRLLGAILGQLVEIRVALANRGR